MSPKTRKLLLNFAVFPFACMEFLAKAYSRVLNSIKPDAGNLWQDAFIRKNQAKIQSVSHETQDGISFRAGFYVPNQICRFRAATFSTKEPETLAWIDELGGGGALFDIGANVGLYSVYYASTKKSAVYSFEPSFLNLGLLAKNIHVNNLSKLIKIVPNPLSNSSQFAEFSLSSIEEGGALSAFGVDYGFAGDSLEKLLAYQTLGFTLDSLFESGVLRERPKLIKIDVDGIEHLILAGAKKTLREPGCKSVLIEVTDSFAEQADGVKAILGEAGFTLISKTHSEMFSKGKFSDGYNQIWIKHQ
jgi:FkbM family methyltransferase